MKGLFVTIIAIIPFLVSSQRLGSFYHDKAVEMDLMKGDDRSSKSEKPDDVKILLEGIAPLSGATIIPTIDASYDGVIADGKSAFPPNYF